MPVPPTPRILGWVLVLTLLCIGCSASYEQYTPGKVYEFEARLVYPDDTERAARHPHRFTAVALLGAPLEPELLAHQEPSRAYTHLPAYIGHGELEPNLETVRATIPLLEELGF
ncbi:MAG: hypothetical protein ABIF77_03665, partial [bacterium]